MKFIHLSDLHLGKRIDAYSMIEDQKYILDKIMSVILTEKPDGIIVAGDIYDKSVPSTEAVSLFDDFLCRLVSHDLRVFLISGNHDSAERTAFASRIIKSSGVYVSPVYDGRVDPVILSDEYGDAAVYLLPFIKPAHVRARFPDEKIESYTDAVACAVRHMDIDPERRNVLVAHQFITGADRSESEDIPIGGLDNVDVSVFADFDYVALGHLHGPQSVERSSVRYCGTPLKYSFSEVEHKKSVTVVELGKKGELSIRTVPLTPLRDMRVIRGTYNELTLRSNYENTPTDDYLKVILTDEDEEYGVMDKLRAIYPNIMKLGYDNTRTRTSGDVSAAADVARKSELELFAEFYERQNGRPMNESQYALSQKLLEEIKEGVK
ncbi:MAG: exonuclease SbcCD subunit D [Clostridia bacterium]|nr:exonuclease SbcCD subunit D [Clostridia bacterium]